MTEKKIEVLFNESIVIGNLLEKNLHDFDKSQHAINAVYANVDALTQTIEHLSLYSEQIKQDESKRFADEIKEQVNRYHRALQDVNLDTSSIEEMIETYDTTVKAQIVKLEESAHIISKTIDAKGDAIIAAASILKRSKIGTMWSLTMFGTGLVAGALFLSAYPIAQISKTFYLDLKERDASIQTIKEQYKTNAETLAFLEKYGITIKHNITDDSWTQRSLRFAPMVLFSKDRVILTDEIKQYTRIIFNKHKEIDDDF
ncbi:MAG: hypothetical protein L3J43_02460 [Sulfurovum sp.]|nr:hypothetical protein [Sulfurovum sp.]